MDLETENRIAAMLMREAAELRRQADKEGVHVYLRQPKARFRPNSRFLTATVLGVQQANRAVEVDEMWRARQKEQELDDRLRGRSRDGSSGGSSHRDHNSASPCKRPPINVNNASASCSSNERVYESGNSREEEELEKFIHSRVKRGRGGVGPRMDETGPYLPPCPDSREELPTSPDVWKRQMVYRPEKPSSLKSSDKQEELHKEKQKKRKKVRSVSSDKQHSRKHRSKDKSMNKKKKSKDEKRNNVGLNKNKKMLNTTRGDPTVGVHGSGRRPSSWGRPAVACHESVVEIFFF